MASIIVSGERLKALPLRAGKEKGAHYYNSYSTLNWKSASVIKQKNKTKDIGFRKE